VRIKLDENIPASSALRLSALGFDVDTVLGEGLNGKTDREVWAGAQAEGRFLVTQDLDFSDARVFAAGTHAGLFIVRLPDSEQWRLGDYLAAWFADPDVESWQRCLVVATPHKLRVIRPPAG
jgi:predicted nuclease of predicted toxin-antitoxin system